jgi:translocation and assembly module TamB
MANQEEPRGRTGWKRWLGVGAALLIVAALGAAVFLRSASFQGMLRQRLVAALEEASGGRVELQEFSFELSRLRIDLRGLTIHGREGAQEPPLFSAELVQVGWKVLSWWGLQADLRSLRIWNPQISVSLDEDGRTNIPSPGGRTNAPRPQVQPMPGSPQGGAWMEKALALRVERLEVLRGRMRFRRRSDENQIPLDFEADNFQVAVAYQAAQNRYSGSLEFQNALLNSRNATPLRSRSRTKFALYSRKLDLESFEWQTAGSHISVQGTMEDSSTPRLQFRYDLLVDGKEAAEVMGSTGWQGEIAWRGEGSYAEQGWQLQGPLALRSARTPIPFLPSVPWNAQAELRLARPAAASRGGKLPPWRGELKDLAGTALGGRFRGNATMEMAFPSLAARLDLEADHISLPALSSALPTIPDPLARLRWAGSISGPVQVTFEGLGNRLVLRAEGHVEPPAVIPPGFTPVSGILRGSYQAEQGRWESQNSYLNLPNASMTADGWLSASDSRLSVTLDSARPGAILTLVRLFWRRSAELPFRLHGRAKAGFLWTGGTKAPNLNGNLQLGGFDFRSSRWDSFSGNFHFRQYSDGSAAPAGAGVPSQESGSGKSLSEIRIDSGRLLRGNASIQFNGGLQLKDAAFTNQSPFSLDATFRNARLEEVQNLAGSRLPVRGTVQATCRISGTLADPRGQGGILLTAGEAFGERFESLTVQLALQPGGLVSAQQIRLQMGKGALQGEAVVGMQSRQYRFSLTGSNLALESFHFLRIANFPVSGVAQVKVSGTGSLSRPAMQGQIEIARLGWGDQKDGKLSISVDAQEGQGHLQWTGNLLGGELQGAGEVRLQSSFPFSARLDFAGVNLASLLRAFRTPPEAVKGQAGGTVFIEGDLESAQTLRLRGEVGSLTASVGTVDFRNVQPARFHSENRVLQLEQLHLTGKGTDLVASGAVRLAHDPALSLTVKGQLELAALEILDPDLSASGQVPIDVNLNGTLRNPLWRGRLDFSDASLRYGSLPASLSRIKGALVFEGNHGTLENFTAESGGGAVKLGGLASFVPEGGLEMQLAAEISGVRIRYPEGVSTWMDGRLTLTGSSKAATLAGNLVIAKQTASSEFDVGASLMRREQQQPLVPVKSAAMRNLRLDVHIVSSENVSLETTTAKNLRGDVDLRLRGTVEHPALLGRISILQGEIVIAGRHYMADRGDLTFSNPSRIESVLHLNVRARVEQYDISLVFAGPLDRLTVTYNSDPPLPTSEILSLLVAGSSYSAARGPSSTAPVAELGANSLLSQALNQQMGSRLERIFGTGHIRIDPQTAGFGSAANANVALEQHIKDNLTLLYVTNVTSAQQQIIEAEVALSPRFSVTAIRDQNGLIGVNFQIRLRFR